jgi:hypothetical protein
MLSLTESTESGMSLTCGLLDVSLYWSQNFIETPYLKQNMYSFVFLFVLWCV